MNNFLVYENVNFDQKIYLRKYVFFKITSNFRFFYTFYFFSSKIETLNSEPSPGTLSTLIVPL